MASIYYKVVELQRKIGSYLFGGSLSTPWKHLSKPVRIALIGLDGAGQVSLLNHIAASGPQPPDLVTRSPPMHMDMAVLKLPRVTIVTTDVGGGDKFRNQRKDLVKKEIDAVIFVIDGKDRDRWIESVEELGQYVLRATELAVTPLLMLANNASDEHALSIEMIEGEIRRRCSQKGRDDQLIKIQPIDAKSGSGVRMGLEWMVSNLMNSKEGLEKERL